MWLRPVLTMPDQVIIRERGLDAFLLLRLLRTGLLLFGPLTLLLLPTLVPVNVTAADPHVTAATGLDHLSWSNIPPGQRSRCWAHLGASICVIGYCGLIIVRELRLLGRLRRKWLLTSRSSCLLPATAVLITDIPETWLTQSNLKDRLRNFYGRFDGGPIAVRLIRDCRTLKQKISQRDRLVLALEAYATRKTQETMRASHRSRQLSPGKSTVQGCRDLLLTPVARQGRKLQLSVSRWLRLLAIFGTKESRIIRRAQSINRLNQEITDSLHHLDHFPVSPSAWILFRDPVAAHLVCQAVGHSTPFRMVAHLIDGIHDNQIIWPNIIREWWRRFVSFTLVACAMTGFAVAWVVPIALTGLLSQAASLSDLVPWAEKLHSLPLELRGAIQGILPQVALTLLMNLFPRLLTILVEQQGCITRTAMELSLQAQYFIFLYIQVFLVVSISSAITAVIPTLLDDLRSTPTVLAQNLPKASNYFLSYIILVACSQSAIFLTRICDWVSHIPLHLRTHSLRIQWARHSVRPSMQLGLVFPVLTNLICLGKSSRGVVVLCHQ